MKKSMSPSLKIGLTLIALVVGLYFAIGALSWALRFIWAIIVPVAVVGSIGYVLYLMFGRKALGGGSRRILP